MTGETAGDQAEQQIIDRPGSLVPLSPPAPDGSGTEFPSRLACSSWQHGFDRLARDDDASAEDPTCHAQSELTQKMVRAVVHESWG